MIYPKQKLWIPSRPAIIVPSRRQLPDARHRIRGSVAQDAISTSEINSVSSATSYNATINLTVGAGLTNGYLTVRAAWDVVVSAITAHWDSAGTNQLMTQVGFASNSTGLVSTALFGLVAPTAGNKNLNITWTGSAGEFLVFGESFTGVDQTTPTSSVQTTNNSSLGANATLSLSAITSAVGNMCVATFSNDFTWASTNQTQEFVTNGGTVAHAANRAAGAGSVTMSATNGTTADNACGVGCNLNAAAGGVVQTQVNQRLMMGVGI